MPSQKNIAVTAAAIVAAGSLISLAVAQLGPLNPPPGPVADTGPSLADLESGTGLPGGLVEFEVFNAPLSGSPSNQFQSTLIADGRVYVKSITSYLLNATLFDGQGQLDNEGIPVTGEVLARSNNDITVSGNGVATYQTSRTDLGVVVEDGLWAAWENRGSDGWLTVVYLPLD